MTSLLEWQGIDSPTTEDIDEVRRDWQRRRLTWFRGQIPDDLRGLAGELGLWGEEPPLRDQELAEVGFFSGPMEHGEPTPFTVDDLVDRPADEAARLISEWRIEASSHETGTTRGFELSFQAATAQQPIWAINVWRAAEHRLPLTFLTSLLDGFRDALRVDPDRFPWDRALPVVRAAVTRVEELDGSRPFNRQRLLTSATDLIEEGVRRNVVPANLEDDAWGTLDAAWRNPVIWAEEVDETFESFDSLLTSALNQTGSRILQAALQTGLWSYRLREGESTDDASRGVEVRFAGILNHLPEPKAPGRVVAEAIIGEYLPHLELLAPGWFRDQLDDLLERGATEPYEHPVWGAYVTRSRFYDTSFTALRRWYVVAAEAAGTVAGRRTSGDNPGSLTRGLVQHVIVAVLRGQAALGDTDRLVETTFTNVPAAERGRAYWSVSRGWSDADEAPPDAFIARLLAFWEWRLDELEAQEDDGAQEAARELGWFLRTPYLPDEDVLSLGLRTARAANGSLELYTNWNRLRELAATDVDAVFEIAELVLRFQLSEQHHFVRITEVEPLLRVALDQGNEDTRRRARRLVHRLGEAGYEDLGDLMD